MPRLTSRAGGALLAFLCPALLLAAFSPPRRVAVVSFDGAGGADLSRRLADGTLGPDGFRKAEAEGFAADRLSVVTPSSTAPSHFSISTGALPAAHGIVANTFHRAGDPLLEMTRGFVAESAVETIWEAAHRQGKRVASVAWPGVAQRTPRNTTDVGLEFGAPQRGAVFSSDGTPPLPDLPFALPVGVVSFSPPRALPASLAGEEARLVLLDGTDDGRRGYDSLVAVSRSGALLGRARAGEWMPISWTRDDGDEKSVLFGRWVKLLALAPDLSRVAVYVGTASRTHARPDDFRRTLERRAGFWPGTPDLGLLARGEIGSFLEQADRLSTFLTACFRAAERRGDWDLLLGYDPVLDDVQHPLLYLDPRQPGATAERRAAAAAALRHAWKVADRAAAAYLTLASRADVFLVSDHGCRPAFRGFRILELLRREGWLKTRAGEDGAPGVTPDSPATAVVTGSLGYVVLNREGAMPGGVVAKEDADALARRIAARLRLATDDEGRPVFTVVATPSEAKALGLDTANAGDLVVVARPGITLKSDLVSEREPLLGPSDQPGQHGADADPELDGIFVHVGEGVPHERVPLVRSLDVARMVAGRLGITPPGSAP